MESASSQPALLLPLRACGAERAYIGMGSNLENPVAQLSRAFDALERLPDSRVVARSCLYRSRPLDDLDQPDYINAVAVVETALDARDLLARLQAIELEHGRVRDAQRWSSRVLDLDLLVFGEHRYTGSDLTVPHPGLTQRDFVLFPLHEVAPELRIPDAGALRELVAACPPRGIACVIPEREGHE